MSDENKNENADANANPEAGTAKPGDTGAGETKAEESKAGQNKAGQTKPAGNRKPAAKSQAAAKAKTTKDESDKPPAGHKEFTVASPIRMDRKTYKMGSKIMLDRDSHAALSRAGAVEGEWPGK